MWELLYICPSHLLREGHQSYLREIYVNKSLSGRKTGRFLFYSPLRRKPMAPSFNLLRNVNIHLSKEKNKCFCGTQEAISIIMAWQFPLFRRLGLCRNTHKSRKDWLSQGRVIKSQSQELSLTLWCGTGTLKRVYTNQPALTGQPLFYNCFLRSAVYLADKEGRELFRVVEIFLILISAMVIWAYKLSKLIKLCCSGLCILFL